MSSIPCVRSLFSFPANVNALVKFIFYLLRCSMLRWSIPSPFMNRICGLLLSVGLPPIHSPPESHLDVISTSDEMVGLPSRRIYSQWSAPTNSVVELVQCSVPGSLESISFGLLPWIFQVNKSCTLQSFNFRTSCERMTVAFVGCITILR